VRGASTGQLVRVALCGVVQIPSSFTAAAVVQHTLTTRSTKLETYFQSHDGALRGRLQSTIAQAQRSGLKNVWQRDDEIWTSAPGSTQLAARYRHYSAA
jgi:hypothetical protein